MMKKISIGGIFLCFWISNVRAQGTTGTIFGTVKDQQGAAVAGASVRIVNDETGESRVIAADSAGRYWASLAPGNYRISIDQQGFEGVEESVALPPARDIVLNFERREAGTGGSRALVSWLEPLSATIAPRTVRELPLSSRSYDALIPLVPGVIPYTPGAGASSFEFGAGPRFLGEWDVSVLVQHPKRTDPITIPSERSGTPPNLSKEGWSRSNSLLSSRDCT